jgi:hypothetical protein
MTDLDVLGQLRATVSPQVEKVGLRGQECSSFLFFESKGRAIEASQNESQWWLEFWNKKDDATPAKELTLDTNQEALAAITDWLRSAGDSMEDQFHFEP